MPECQLVKAASRTFADYTDRLDVSGEAPRILVHFDAGTGVTDGLGCGVAILEKIAFPWKVSYDEYFYYLDGTFTLKTEDGEFEMVPGDGFWLPNGTELVYEAKDRCEVVVIVYPASQSAREAAAFGTKEKPRTSTCKLIKDSDRAY